jgi:hypothetical protein
MTSVVATPAGTAVAISVFVEVRFWLLVVFSLIAPVAIYALLWAKRVISPWTVLVFGIILVLIAGVDVYLLQSLATQAKGTLSLIDDTMFLSELSVALYVLPVVFGGIGVNLISHVLLRHLTAAERRLEQEKTDV